MLLLYFFILFNFHPHFHPSFVQKILPSKPPGTPICGTGIRCSAIDPTSFAAHEVLARLQAKEEAANKDGMGRAKRPTGGGMVDGWMDGVCSCWLVGLSKDGSVKDGAIKIGFLKLIVDRYLGLLMHFLGKCPGRSRCREAGTWMVSTSKQ